MPGFASFTAFESSGLTFLSSFQVVPSVDVRCGLRIRPGHWLNEFGNMWRTPSRSITAPGLMYRSSVPASFVSTTTSGPNMNRWVTAGGGDGVMRGVAVGEGRAAGVGVLDAGAEVPHPQSRPASTSDIERRMPGNYVARRWSLAEGSPSP